SWRGRDSRHPKQIKKQKMLALPVEMAYIDSDDSGASARQDYWVNAPRPSFILACSATSPFVPDRLFRSFPVAYPARLRLVFQADFTAASRRFCVGPVRAWKTRGNIIRSSLAGSGALYH